MPTEVSGGTSPFQEANRVTAAFHPLIGGNP